jgi:hypothetical protein
LAGRYSSCQDQAISFCPTASSGYLNVWCELKKAVLPYNPSSVKSGEKHGRNS